MIHIYTGNGKGKTTAAVGLALRATGAGLKVCLIQFLKGSTVYCELKMLKKAKIIKFKEAHPAFCAKEKIKVATSKLMKQAEKDFLAAKKITLNKMYDVIIMDEVINLVSQGFVPENELIGLIDELPRKAELVLTGRGASKKLIRKADYVTDMRLVKHPYYKGKKARKGIEY